MLLRIIDNPTMGVMTTSLKLILEDSSNIDSEPDSYSVASYTSPFNDNFKDVFHWYFNDYLIGKSHGEDKSDVVGKLIKFGRYLGDELLGENHELMRFIEKIDSVGYANVDVALESKRIEFFAEFWETLILPEANYFISAAARSFQRKFVGKEFADALPAKALKLNIAPPQQDQVAQLLGTNDSTQQAAVEHNPLHVLKLVADGNHSLAMKTSIDAVIAGSAIEYTIAHKPTLTYCTQLLSGMATTAHDEDRQTSDNSANQESIKSPHVVHYNGPVRLIDGKACLQFAATDTAEAHSNTNTQVQYIDVDTLAAILVDNGVLLLCIDATEYTAPNSHGEQQPIHPSLGLASIAYAAQQQGLGNIIGLNEVSNPWLNQQCFDSIYSAILNGFSIAQAIVEARKVLQNNVESILATPVAIPFHPWSLIAHYGSQEVVFFAGQQTLADPYESPELAKLHQRLFGFRSESLPPLLNSTSDGLALPLAYEVQKYTQQLQQGRSIVLSGEAGIGKTHITHLAATHIAQQQWVNFSFYYDFGSNDYSADDMLEMIAPIFELPPTDKNTIQQRLAQQKCCFVFDDIHAVTPDHKDALQSLFAELKAMGHCLISVINTSEANVEQQETLAKLVACDVTHTVMPLDDIEQKIFASQCIQKQKIPNIQLNHAWDDLLTGLQGHPWLIEKSLPLLLARDISDVQADVQNNVLANSNVSKVHGFYEWQWQQLDTGWQKLLILASEQKALLLETLMIAADQKEEFAPAKALMTSLGGASSKFSEALIAWELAGLLNRMPHGRMVDPRVIPFIESRKTSQKIIFSETDQLQFSQILCEGIRLLSQHVLKQPNPAISNNLLFNRRFWVKHFETLWFKQDYRGFIGVKHAFEQLLLQAKLQDESKQWALDLLSRTPIATDDAAQSMESKLAWLMLAASALDNATVSADNTVPEASIAEGAAIWQQWFTEVNDDIAQEQLALFHQVAGFLELYYRSQKQWQNSITVCQKAVSIYQRYEAWHRVIQAWRSEANYQAQLNNHDLAITTEERIFNEIPYENSPPGFKSQQMLEVLMARVARKATDAAQDLLDKIQATEEAERLKDMLEGVQCDLFYQKQQYLKALPYYCRIWAKSLQTNQQLQIEQLRERLLELEEKVGFDAFASCFAEETPAGTVLPKEYQSQLN